jgi:membrane dipeptidase
MKPSTLLAAALLSCACASTPPDPDAHARELAQRYLITDGHIDAPSRVRRTQEDVGVSSEGEFDFPRAVEGGLNAPFMSIYVGASYEDQGGGKALADELIDWVEQQVARHPDKFTLAVSVADGRRAFAEGKVALFMGMENGTPIEGELDNLDYFYDRGIRYITLCHSKDNHICDSSYDDRHTHGGLTDFGRLVVQRMNELGIMVDVSHISDDAFWDVMEVTAAPVIASHSSLRHFVPGFERNMSDEMVVRLAENGGVVQINFGSSFISEAYREESERRRVEVAALLEEAGVDRRSEEGRAISRAYSEEHPPSFADVTDVADHIDRVVQLVGVDHVGLGSDFDGVGDSLPTGLKDVSDYPNLIAELLRRGYSDGDVEKICSGNVFRVLAEVERIAAETTTP